MGEAITASRAEVSRYAPRMTKMKIDPAKIIDLHLTWQDRYTDDLVRPLSRGVIRDVISQYGIEQVVSTKRAELANSIVLVEEVVELEVVEENVVVVVP